MTFAERNDTITERIVAIKAIHDKYTSSARLLKSEEWDRYMELMTNEVEKVRGTNLESFVYDLVICFQNDTEDVQRRLKNVKKD
jgi:deoxyadenosine/deoxycytidine kinase